MDIQIPVNAMFLYVIVAITLSAAIIVIVLDTGNSKRSRRIQEEIEELRKQLRQLEMRPANRPAQQPAQRITASATTQPTTPLGSAWVRDQLPEQAPEPVLGVPEPVQTPASAPVEWWRS